MDVKKLLDLLEDPQVQRKIRSIIQPVQSVHSVQSQQAAETPARESKPLINWGGDEKLKKKILQLESEKESIKAENKKLGEALTAYQREYQNIKSQKELSEKQLQKDIEILQRTIEQSSTEKLSLKRELEHTESKLQKSNNKIDELIKEMNFIEQKSNELQNKAAYYQKKYKNIDDCFESYLSLGTAVHEDLERVLSAESPEIFFSYGVQWTNIEALWDFISYKLTKYNSNEINILSNIFDYFFECYQNINTNYKRLTVNIGDEFDDDIHTRASNSAVSGNISEILLIGYQGIKNGKIKKSIVRM